MDLTAVMSFQMTQIKGLVTPFKILPMTSKILRMRKSNLPYKLRESISLTGSRLEKMLILKGGNHLI